MDYKIIVLDLDGTLTNRDKIITPRTKEALMKAQEAGKIVVLASGRPSRTFGKRTGTGPVWKLYFILQWRYDHQLQNRRSDFFLPASGRSK